MDERTTATTRKTRTSHPDDELAALQVRMRALKDERREQLERLDAKWEAYLAKERAAEEEYRAKRRAEEEEYRAKRSAEREEYLAWKRAEQRETRLASLVLLSLLLVLVLRIYGVI